MGSDVMTLSDLLGKEGVRGSIEELPMEWCWILVVVKANSLDKLALT